MSIRGIGEAAAATVAVQGLTKTEFVSVYHDVCRMIHEEEAAATRATLTSAYTPGQEAYDVDDGIVNGEGGMPRSQSEPAHLHMPGANATTDADGFLGEPSQVSAWAAMEQGSVVEGQAATVANGSGSQQPVDSQSGSNPAQGGSQQSLERLSKTAPGKAQNPNQHWFPETEDILGDTPTKIKGGTLPQGSALEAARRKNK